MKKVTKKTTKKVVNKKTHVSIILDRTGSMSDIKPEVIGGYNAFLEEQKKSKKKITLSLVQFDSLDPFEVLHDMVPVKDAKELTDDTFQPRGCTPLLDAIGKGISSLDVTLGLMKKSSRPQNIVIVIITDGQENASHVYNKGQIEEMLKNKKKDGWQFVFLSSDMSSIGDAHAYGFTGGSTLAYTKCAGGTTMAFQSLTRSLNSYTKGICSDVTFTQDDRTTQDLAKGSTSGK